MAGVLLVRDLHEERGGLVCKGSRIHIRRTGQAAETAVIEHVELVERDGHVRRERGVRRRKHLS